MSIRKTVYGLIGDPTPRGRVARSIRLSLQGLILLNVLAVVFESVDSIHAAYADAFRIIESISVAIFSLEYGLRFWASAECDGEAPVWRKRLHFVKAPYSLIDLMAILPFFLSFVSVDLRFIRAFRFFRLARIAKMVRYWDALTLFARIIRRKQAELVSSLLVFFVFLLVSSGCIYFAEQAAEDSPFTSIPTAMWWATVTMTTVGYGDIVPVTVLGKVIAAFTALLGIALLAIFAAIMVSGFSEEAPQAKDS